MPGLNQQGPEGSGPMTGRQRGMCKRTEELPQQGRRDGQGRGMRRRCRGSFVQTPEGRLGANKNDGGRVDSERSRKTR